MASAAPVAATASPAVRVHAPEAVAAPSLIDVTYVDEARTHRIQARVVRGSDGGFTFLVLESPCAAFQGEDVLRTEIPIRDAWEARFHQADLEGRLAQMGRYWRYDRERKGWLALRPHPGVPRIDLRAVDWPEAGGGVAFHHFHHGGGKEHEKLLVAVPRAFPSVGQRFLLADIEFDFPRAKAGELHILHQRLPPAPLKSLLTREHVEMARRGFEKLIDPREFAFLYGPEWKQMMREAFHEAMERIHEGREGPGVVKGPAERDDDGLVSDYQRILVDPRLAAVHRKYLTKDEEEELLATNEVALKRWIASRRRSTRHEEQHLISLLEASLLARLGLRHGSHVDPQVAKQLRRLAFYL